MQPQTSPDDAMTRRRLEDIRHAYRRSQILISSTRLGVFEAISSGPAIARELGARLSLDPARLRLLLDAAAALGLLERHCLPTARGPETAAPPVSSTSP